MTVHSNRRKSNQPFWPLERNFLVCRLMSFLALVIVSCLAKGEKSASLSLHSPWKSFSASPLIVRSTKALALCLWVLNRPLMEVTNPSPAPSLGRLRNVMGYWSGFPGWSLSLKARSISGDSRWLWALSLNFLPCKSRGNDQPDGKLKSKQFQNLRFNHSMNTLQTIHIQPSATQENDS